MKLKVADHVKGRLSIASVYGVYSAGAEIELSEDVIQSNEVQTLLRSGVLEGDAAIIKDFFVQYKNLSARNISFKWGQYVKPHQIFLVEKKNLDNPELKIFVKEGLIAAVAEKEIADTQVVATTVASTDVAPSKSTKAEKSKIKRVKEKKIETQANSSAEHKSNTMHAHTPAVIESEAQESNDINKDSSAEKVVDAEQETVRFVDQEQKKEKFERLQKIINEKINANRKK